MTKSTLISKIEMMEKEKSTETEETSIVYNPREVSSEDETEDTRSPKERADDVIRQKKAMIFAALAQNKSAQIPDSE